MRTVSKQAAGRSGAAGSRPLRGLAFETGHFEPLWLPSFLSREECAGVTAAADRLRFGEAEVVGGLDYARIGEVAWLRRAGGKRWLFERLEALGRDYARAIGFRVDGISEPLQVVRYARGGHFDWHIDVGAGEERSRKLTIIVQLTSAHAYAGGELEFCNLVPSIYHRAMGSVLIFPSILGHKVNPITRGRRTALVAWVDGPSLR